jgi:hypothetical protein
MRWTFLRFTGCAAARRTRAVIIRSPAAGACSMILRIVATNAASTTGGRGTAATGGR